MKQILSLVLWVALAASNVDAQGYIYGVDSGGQTNPIMRLQVTGSGVNSMIITNIDGTWWAKLDVGTPTILSNGLISATVNGTNIVYIDPTTVQTNTVQLTKLARGDSSALTNLPTSTVRSNQLHVSPWGIDTNICGFGIDCKTLKYADETRATSLNPGDTNPVTIYVEDGYNRTGPFTNSSPYVNIHLSSGAIVAFATGGMFQASFHGVLDGNGRFIREGTNAEPLYTESTAMTDYGTALVASGFGDTNYNDTYVPMNYDGFGPYPTVLVGQTHSNALYYCETPDPTWTLLPLANAGEACDDAIVDAAYRRQSVTPYGGVYDWTVVNGSEPIGIIDGSFKLRSIECRVDDVTFINTNSPMISKAVGIFFCEANNIHAIGGAYGVGSNWGARMVNPVISGSNGGCAFLGNWPSDGTAPFLTCTRIGTIVIGDVATTSTNGTALTVSSGSDPHWIFASYLHGPLGGQSKAVTGNPWILCDALWADKAEYNVQNQWGAGSLLLGQIDGASASGCIGCGLTTSHTEPAIVNAPNGAFQMTAGGVEGVGGVTNNNFINTHVSEGDLYILSGGYFLSGTNLLWTDGVQTQKAVRAPFP